MKGHTMPHPPDTHTPAPTHEADLLFSESLANARLTALRALVEIVNTTEDPVEKRHAATAILRAPDPAAHPSARSTPRSPRTSRPESPPPHHHPPSPASPHSHPRSTREIDELLASAEELINDESFIDSIIDLPDITSLKLPRNAAARIAAQAGAFPHNPTHNGAP
jgi:hypothetical protein